MLLNTMQCLIITVYALKCAYDDFKKRGIDVKLSIAAGILGLIVCLIADTQNGDWHVIKGMSAAIVPGAVLMLLSYISNGSIGLGDGVFILICGLYMSFNSVLAATLATWMICAFIGLFFVIRDVGKRKNRSIPFVTAMLPAILLVSILRLKAICYGI